MALPAVYPSKPPHPPNPLKRPDAMVSKHNVSSGAPGSTSMSLQRLETTAESNTNNDKSALLVEWSFTMDAVTGRWCRRIVNKEDTQRKIPDSRLDDDCALTETSPSEAPEVAAQWTFYQELDPVRWIPHKSGDEDFKFTARLQSGQLRLFHLALDDSDTIHIAIATFDLHTAPTYIAISYVCGTDERGHDVFVNGRRFKIKRNLLATLQKMKCLFRDGMFQHRGSEARSPFVDIWVWADAICINQEDIVEKAAQVREMHEVYRKAHVVTVFLYGRALQGERLGRLCSWLEDGSDICAVRSRIQGSPILREVFKHPPHVLRRLRARQLALEPLIDQDYGLSREVLAALIETTIARRGESLYTLSEKDLRTSALFWSDCLDIFLHEWFSRVWTCQEVRLAILSNGASIFLRNRCINWSTLSALYLITLLVANFDQIEGTKEQFAMVMKRIWALSSKSLIDVLDVENLRHDVWHLLVATTQRRATHGKDHIYAMLGLMPPEIRDCLVPDYTHTDAEVFTKALRIVIIYAEGAKQLPMLWEQLSFLTSSTVGLPSWCPDFRNEAGARAVVFSDKKLSQQVVQRFKPFAALSLDPLDGPITLQVMIVDSVAIVLAVSSPSRFCPTDLTPELLYRQKEWLLRLHDCFACSGSLYDGFGAELDAFLLSFHEPLFQPPLCSCFSFGAFLSHDPNCNTEGDASGIQHPDQHSQQMQDPDMSRATDEGNFVETICSQQHGSYQTYLTVTILAWTVMLADTYVFKTAAGRFGYSPKLPSPGDRICLIPGGQLLHIISESTAARYKGAASVHGLMEDSLLSEVPDPEGKFEDITLY